jgi:hypothetical protein
MTEQETNETERDDGLKNPMRFSIRNRRIDVDDYLRHDDFADKQVTEIEIQDGQLYVHWEQAPPTDTDEEYSFYLVKASDSLKWHWFEADSEECFCGNVKSFAIAARDDPGGFGYRCVSETCLAAFRRKTEPAGGEKA